MVWYPTPDEIPGTTVCRQLKIPDDPAIIATVIGALDELAKSENWDKVGAIEPQVIAERMLEMIAEFVASTCTEGQMPTIGEYKMLAHEHVPDKWLLCRGGVVAQADYPELYAEIGGRYDTGGEGEGNFRLPDFSHRSPMGAPSNEYVGAQGGDLQRTLTTANLPPHNHSIARGGSGAPNVPQVAAATGAGNAPMTTGNTGGGEPFSIVHPIRYANIIIYAGR